MGDPIEMAAVARAQEVCDKLRRRGYTGQGRAFVLELLAAENQPDGPYALAYRSLAVLEDARPNHG